MTVSSPVSARASTPSPQANLAGLGVMALGMFLFSAVDAGAKFLTAELHPLQIVWFRQLGLALGVVVLLGVRGRSILRTAHPRLQVLRGMLAVISATFFITAVAYIPLADAASIAFVAPFLVTVLGALILRERVGARRWIAVVIGFCGAMIVIRPGFGSFHPAALLVVVAATMFAVRQIISRALAHNDRVVTTVAYTALVSIALLSIPLPFVWVTPSDPLTYLVLIGIAVTAAGAETMVIKALQMAEAVVVAPVQYTLLLWGTLYGWLIFGQLPDLWTWVGALILIATGIYTLHRERLAARGTR